MGIGKKIVGQGCVVRDDFIVKHCADKHVLHVGCTDYPFFQTAFAEGYLLHDKVAKVSKRVVGIDTASDDISAMLGHGYVVKEMDAQTMANHAWDEAFDVILLADVIEHITNPGLVICEARKLLAPKGTIVVTVPNTFGIVRYLKSFFRYEQVHPDHIAYYSSGVLETLAERMDLQVQKSAWYRFEVRDKRLVVYLSAALEKVATAFFPWHAEGCIAVMTPSTADNDE